MPIGIFKDLLRNCCRPFMRHQNISSALACVFEYLTLQDVMKLRVASNREVNKVIRLTLSAVSTRPNARNIKVTKLVSIFPNLSSIVYRHFMTDTDIKNSFR